MKDYLYMVMPRNYLYIVLILFTPKILGAQYFEIDTTTHKLLQKGLHQVHIEKYNESIDTFKEIIRLHPQHPAGYFCAAAVYQTIMRNYRINSFESQFDSLLNLTIQIGERSIKQQKNDAYSYFYLGGAYGFRGLHKVRKRDWLGAFSDGLKGVTNLKKAIKINCELYDVYYGLGTYHYWRSAGSKFLRFLLFFKDDQQKGIDQIETAIKRGKYTLIECKYALVAIYYDCEDYQKAFTINQELFELFPTNPSCLYMRGRLYEQQRKWNEAKNTFQQLLKHIFVSEYVSPGYQAECYYRIAYCHYKLGEIYQAHQQVKNALALNTKRDASKEIEGPLENFDEINKSANKLYEDINDIISYDF